jgi:hypothetical protein
MRARGILARVLAAIVLAVAALSLGGCTPDKPHIYVDPAAVSQGYRTLVVADVKNGELSEAPAELLDRTGKRLGDQLKELGFSVQSEQASAGTQGYLIVVATMQQYEGGSVLGRWVGFGSGAAKCTLQVELRDGQSGKKVGDAVTTQIIAVGGLYSIGAGDYIVDRCADSVASGIAEKLLPAKSGG